MYKNITKILVYEVKECKQVVRSIPANHYWTFISMPENTEVIMHDMMTLKEYIVPINCFRRNMKAL